MRKLKVALQVFLALMSPLFAGLIALAALEPAPPREGTPAFELVQAAKARPAEREVASPVDAQLHEMARAVADSPENADLQVRFALLLGRKAREVGNAAYHRMAERACKKALEKKPDHATGRGAYALALLGEHRFQDAHDYLATVPGKSVWRLSCLYDALYELGRYDEALQVVQDLVDLRPGIESYPRVAQARELMGFPAEADEMWSSMEGVNDAAPATLRAWARTQRGDLALRLGDLDGAHACYAGALELYPGYYLALAGEARVKAARGDLAGAEALLTPLMAAHGDIPTAGLLGDVQLALGKSRAAESTFAEALAGEELSARLGVPDRRALAVFLADHDRELPRALAAAEAELAARPTIYDEDALAWALLKSGRAAEARVHEERARRLKTKNPHLSYHAGAIEVALGDTKRGATLLKSALETGLRADPLQARRAEEILRRLGL